MPGFTIENQILFQDEYLLVLNKPSGLMVEPDRNNHPNLQQAGKAYLRKTSPQAGEVYLQHIHRLDRPVSGVILFAKQKSVLKNLSEQFAFRTVRKYYQALTATAPAALSAEITHWLRKEKKKAVLYATEIEYSEKAVLKYDVAPRGDHFLWNIELHTGKYHQIRAQLASLGCPVIGDELYGSVTPYRENAIALCACKLVFKHPVSGEEMVMVAELV